MPGMIMPIPVFFIFQSIGNAELFVRQIHGFTEG
jgi:hypothetical protein